MTVAELGARLTSAELVEWLALHRLEAREEAERSLRDDLMTGARAAARHRREQARNRPRGAPTQGDGDQG